MRAFISLFIDIITAVLMRLCDAARHHCAPKTSFFLTALFAPLLFSSAYANESERNIASLDWTVAETILALGVTPVAVGDKRSYSHWVSQPELPAESIDLGVRMQPNLELLIPLAASPKPLVFINSSFYNSATPLLKKFTDHVEIVDFYTKGYAWHNVVNATKQIATLLGKETRFKQLMQDYKETINDIRPGLQSWMHRPVALVQFIDTRHLRIYAQNSLFGAVLFQLGFQNAWTGRHNQWGFENIDVAQLAKLPRNTRFVIIKPYPANLSNELKYNTLWQHLELAKDPVILPALWTFGGIPSAQRFAQMFAYHLLHRGEQW